MWCLLLEIFTNTKEIMGRQKLILIKLTRMETAMAKATEQLTDLNNKFDGLQFQFTDFVNDVRAALVAINADTLSPTAQAQLDQLMSKTDALASQLASADTEVGDADGSDTPAAPVDPSQPAPEQPVDETPAV
jgi:peptidoglycan hydrolase CwlO-like protein